MRPVYVCGLGLWTPGHADPAAWCLRKEDPSVEVPEATLLTHALRRRASHFTRMGVEVLQQAMSQGGRDSTNTPSVWATAHGEHETALAILGMMQRGEGKLSPTQFHNSVHNTASGYVRSPRETVWPRPPSRAVRSWWQRHSWRGCASSRPEKVTSSWPLQTNRCGGPSINTLLGPL